jgi:phenylpropionate dioxygenase-like ring-hydroxylating dioxygenase large terminal subunit
VLSAEHNALLTQVGSGTPMGALMREYWHPVLRSARLERDGDPVAVRLLGEDFVAFRDSVGNVGLLDRACPHRGASLLLARNEQCGLRCLYHGWKLDASGALVESPNASTLDGDRLGLRRHRTREAAGVVWAYIGPPEREPPFPAMPFTRVADEKVSVIAGVLRCNWLQVVEGSWDPTHVGVLHREPVRPLLADAEHARSPVPASELAPMNGVSVTGNYEADIDWEEQPFGFRYRFAMKERTGTALDGEWMPFVMPGWCFIGPPRANDGHVFGHVPIDDDNTLMWILGYHSSETPGLFSRMYADSTPTPDDFTTEVPRDGRWGQDREAMRLGRSFTGVGVGRGVIGILGEDVAVVESMGRVIDRTREHLSASDVVVVKGRRMLLDAVAAHQRGERAFGADCDLSTLGAAEVASVSPGAEQA